MDEVVSFCKSRGFVFPGSEIYGSVGTGYDYGPLGAQLKKNLQDLWWRDFVERRADSVGLESAIIMNPRGACDARCAPAPEANEISERLEKALCLEDAAIPCWGHLPGCCCCSCSQNSEAPLPAIQ